MNSSCLTTLILREKITPTCWPFTVMNDNIMFLKNQVHFLVGVKPKDATKPKIRRKKGGASPRGSGGLQSPSFNELKSKGPEKIKIITPQVALDVVIQHSKLIFTIEQKWEPLHLTILFLLLLLLLPYNSNLFLHSFIPLRSLTTETCSRASIAARLSHTMLQAKNSFTYVKKAMPGFLSPGTPYLIHLQLEFNCI